MKFRILLVLFKVISELCALNCVLSIVDAFNSTYPLGALVFVIEDKTGIRQYTRAVCSTLYFA